MTKATGLKYFAMACVAAGLLAQDALAQRRRGGGGRSPSRSASPARQSPSRSASTARQAPSRTAAPSRTTPSRSSANAVADRAAPGTRNLEQHLGLDRSTLSSTARSLTGQTAGQLASQYGSAYQPFSPAWYAQHPNAFKVTHPHADAFVAASATGLAGWLAVASVPVSTAVVSEETVAGEGSESTAAEQTAESAGNLAAAGAADLPSDAEWVQVGVYVLAPQGQEQPTRLLQLLISKEGVLRGSHVDLISDEVLPIQGSVDKSTLRSAWTVGQKGKVIFDTPLGELTKDRTSLKAFFPNGESTHWQLTRAEN